MLNNKPIIGYLASDGKFMACFTYNHTDCAMKASCRQVNTWLKIAVYNQNIDFLQFTGKLE